MALTLNLPKNRLGIPVAEAYLKIHQVMLDNDKKCVDVCFGLYGHAENSLSADKAIQFVKMSFNGITRIEIPRQENPFEQPVPVLVEPNPTEQAVFALAHRFFSDLYPILKTFEVNSDELTIGFQNANDHHDNSHHPPITLPEAIDPHDSTYQTELTVDPDRPSDVS